MVFIQILAIFKIWKYKIFNHPFILLCNWSDSWWLLWFYFILFYFSQFCFQQIEEICNRIFFLKIIYNLQNGENRHPQKITALKDFFFFSILWGRWISDHLQEDLTKFGYRSKTKHKIILKPGYTLATCKNLWSNYGDFKFFFSPQNMATLTLGDCFFSKRILLCNVLRFLFCFFPFGAFKVFDSLVDKSVIFLY